MNKTTDFTKAFQDVLSAYPMDTAVFQNAFRTQAAFGEKFSKVALDAADKSTEISAKWARDTIARLCECTRARGEVSDYSKAVTDFASNAAEVAAEHMAAFAEIAKKLQMETVELMLATGKEVSEDATAAVKKATADVTTAARKTAAAAAAR